ncbi:hypothetical protein EV182_006291 [Spiromyces aspiralis]|uniref:Uncharacterized protein n=1 Tax=Spiromyces aspiralis TaxID=68401 RepID=A0ACC1HLL9_9FUNG|nr:hypothetical protein EV182_006291 [Spiromyces aspiralis]
MKIERRGRKKGSTNSTKSKLSSAKAGGELHGDDKRRRRTLSGGKQALTSDYSLSPSPSSLAGGTVSKATLSTTAGMPLSNMSTPTFASNGPAGGKNLPGILEEGEVDESPGGDGMAGLMHMGSMSGGSLGLSQTMLASGSAGRPSGLAIHNNSCDLDGDDDDDDDDEEPLLAFLDKSAAGNGSDELQPMASLRTVVNGDDNGNNNDASFFGDDNSNGAISQDTGLDLDDAQMPK